jgi:glutathione S-transferase
MSLSVLPGVVLVSILALVLYSWTGLQVARMRSRHGVHAPATTGHPDFERAFRVQANTLEQLVPFLVALWLCALFLSILAAEILGLVWVAGRLLYAVSYQRNPAKRGPGFGIAYLALALLAVGAVAGAIRVWLATP